MRIGLSAVAAPSLPSAGTVCETTGGQTAAGVIIPVGVPGVFDANGNCLPGSPASAVSPLQFFITGNSFGIPNWAATGSVLVLLWLLLRGKH